MQRHLEEALSAERLSAALVTACGLAPYVYDPSRELDFMFPFEL